MLAILKIFAKRLLFAFQVIRGKAFCYSGFISKHHCLSFSQEGEDRILMRIFERQETGFYVDVGAHHPQRFSNTYLFYLRGWRGINIDPLPGSKVLFEKLREKDINLEMGVANKHGSLIYHAFEEPAFNTFDIAIAGLRTSRLLAKKVVTVSTLSDILTQYAPAGIVIDFLTVDVEGLDLEVLQSNDWTRFRPRYVLTEALDMHDIKHVQDTDLHSFMASVGYSFFAKAINTLFFKDNSLP